MPLEIPQGSHSFMLSSPTQIIACASSQQRRAGRAWVAVGWAQLAPPRTGSRSLCTLINRRRRSWAGGNIILRRSFVLSVACGCVVVVDRTRGPRHRGLPAARQRFVRRPLPLALTRHRIVVKFLPTVAAVSRPSVWQRHRPPLPGPTNACRSLGPIKTRRFALSERIIAASSAGIAPAVSGSAATAEAGSPGKTTRVAAKRARVHLRSAVTYDCAGAGAGAGAGCATRAPEPRISVRARRWVIPCTDPMRSSSNRTHVLWHGASAAARCSWLGSGM